MSETFKIGIEMALVDAGLRAGMAQLTASLFKVRGLQKKIEAGFGKWKDNLGLIGGMSIFASYGIAKGIMSVANASKGLLDIQVQLENHGVSHNKVLETTAKFYSEVAKQVPTATVEEYLKVVGELRSITGADDAAFDKAAGMAPKALQYEALLANMKGGHKGGGGEYYQMLRATELKGVATNDVERDKLIQRMFELVYAFQGKLTTNDMLSMARQAGSAWKSLDYNTDQKIDSLTAMAVLAADLGGSKAGTTLKSMSMMQAGSTAISQQQIKILSDAGVLDRSKLRKGAFGTSYMEIGALKKSTDYVGKTPAYIQDVIAPAIHDLAKKKKAGGELGTEEQIYDILMDKAMNNRSTQRFASMFGNAGFLDQLTKDAGLADLIHKLGLDQIFSNFYNNNPVAVEAGYESAKNNMWAAIGSPVMTSMAIPVMKAVTELFQEIGRLANANPGVVEAIAIGLGALAAALAVTGIGLVIAAIGPVGWIAAGIVALIGAVAAFAPETWKHIIGALQALINLNAAGIADNLILFGIDIFAGIVNALVYVIKNINAWLKQHFTFEAPTIHNPFAAPQRRADPSDPEGDKFLQKQSAPWEPGARGGKVIQISHKATLDGEVLARSISQYLAASMEHPVQAPYFDGLSSYTSPDYGIGST
jgi:hypothetical protein